MALKTNRRGNLQSQLDELKRAVNQLQEQIGDGGGSPITSEDISDASDVGKSLLTATNPAAGRTAINAGTSNLALGTTNSTAAAGNHTHSEYATTTALAAIEARVAALETP